MIISVVSILAIDFCLQDIEEIVSWGSEFGEIYYRLCLSIIASYIFYFIVIHLKSMRDKENINTFVSSKVSQILGDYRSQLSEIKKVSDLKDAKTIYELEEWKNLLIKISPKAQAPLILGTRYATWMQYFSYYNKRTQSHIQKIFVHMPFLDSELVKILAHIDDCSHFSVIDLLSSVGFKNESMENFADMFLEYSNMCQELDEYYKKKLLEYKK